MVLARPGRVATAADPSAAPAGTPAMSMSRRTPTCSASTSATAASARCDPASPPADRLLRRVPEDHRGVRGGDSPRFVRMARVGRRVNAPECTEVERLLAASGRVCCPMATAASSTCDRSTSSEWQRCIALDRHPEQFLRGLIHSDGWRGMNRVRGANGSTYAYPRYQFSNRSDDIKRLFCDACDRLGIEWRRMNAVAISVARRQSVAMLDEFVGPKA